MKAKVARSEDGSQAARPAGSVAQRVSHIRQRSSHSQRHARQHPHATAPFPLISPSAGTHPQPSPLGRAVAATSFIGSTGGPNLRRQCRCSAFVWHRTAVEAVALLQLHPATPAPPFFSTAQLLQRRTFEYAKHRVTPVGPSGSRDRRCDTSRTYKLHEVISIC